MNIIAQLQGGLGNQLFQYATARAVANRFEANLMLDTAWFETSHVDVTKRAVELLDLNIQAHFISQSPVLRRPKKIRKIVQGLFPLNPYIYAEKKPYRFEGQLEKLTLRSNQNLYLMGYWQSYKYFSKIRDLLIQEISPKNGLDKNYQEFLTKIKNSASAMVHIRRGDYVHLPAAAKVHGFLGLAYYEIGMSKLLQKNPAIEFYVFSDDIDWARQNLPYQEKITYIDVCSTPASVTQELFLMSQCDYHLIANSSLSWWGAWLAQGDTGEIGVICPSQWTNDSHESWNDLIPESWIRI